MDTLALLGVALDHLGFDGQYYTGEFSKEESVQVHKHCPVVSVLITDLETYFIENNAAGEIKRSNPEYPVPEGFVLGSMGGYFTPAELDSHIAVMEIKYPDIFKRRDTIGLSVEGRPILALKVSDNVNTDEDEVEILYTALHHAREPVSLSQLLYYLYYLLENYRDNPEVKALVDNSEMYFIPLVNPDGYAYNYLNNPRGGGYWRKNRRKNPDGSYGVDLNRNYGYNWGLNDIGSSGTTTSTVYRGQQAFSEPETRAVRDFCLNRQFAAALNYHAYGNYLIYPWGPDMGPSTAPDQMLFADMAKALTFSNAYKHGTCYETLLYSVNGDVNDWMYGEQTDKNKMISFTPEVGTATDGFWPLQSRIQTLCDENIRQNLNLVRRMLGWELGVSATGSGPAALYLYPNPASDRVFTNASIQGIRVVFYDMAGKAVYTALPHTDGSMDISFLQAGLYTCVLTDALGNSSYRKLIVGR